MHFHALGRTKPLKKEVIVAMYSPQAVRMAAKGSRNSDDLFDMIFCSPPSQMDMTWTRKGNKRGLKSPSETWPVCEQHVSKDKQTLSEIFVLPSTAEADCHSAEVPEVFRFDYAEQAVKHQVHARSGLSWNPGSVRQRNDISSFLAGTWSYIAMQECDRMDLQRLESLGYSVVGVAESGLAVAMPEHFLIRSGQLVQAVDENLQSGQWALRGMFGRFDLRVPEGWPLQNLAVGSAHLNNTVASQKLGRTRDLLQQLFAKAVEFHCDILGLDLKQGLGQLSDELHLFIQKNNLQPVATELLGRREGDCCGWLVLPGSQLLTLNCKDTATSLFTTGICEFACMTQTATTRPLCFAPSTTVAPEGK